MNVKSLTGGLVISLAAATGAVAAAPNASASIAHYVHPDRAWCTLQAHAFRGNDTGFGRGDRARIRVTFTLRGNEAGKWKSLWRVEIRQNGRRIDLGDRRTRQGLLSVVKVARDTYRRDRFVAIATNPYTGQTCRATATVSQVKF